jgi:hypothetical protein
MHLLTPTQQLILLALMDRIIPADQDLSATEAGVADYLARQLAGDLHAYVETYRVGLEALQAEAQASAQAGFTDLPPAEQDALLQRVEVGDVVHAWPLDPIAFFQAVVQHVTEGYYSDPGNGGNRGAASWQMLGFVPGESRPASP